MLIILSVLTLATSPTGLVAEAATIDRGEFKAGAPLVQEFKLTNRSPNQSAKITGVKLSCGCSKHAFDKETLAPGESTRLMVHINTLAQPAGAWSWAAAVRYRLANEPLEETLSLGLHGTLLREITLSPPGLAFSLESGAATQDITITDSRAIPLAIRSADSTNTIVAVKLHPGQKPGQTRFAVTVDAKLSSAGEHHGSIVVATNDPVYPELRIPVTISIRRAGTVKAYPADVEYELPTPPVAGSQRVQIRRPDGQPVQIAGCDIDDGNIGVTWSKDRAAVATIALTFTEALAKRAGAGKAELRVRLSEPAGEVLTIPVNWR